MRFLILTAITVLYAVPASADNMPPVPKKACSTLTVKAVAEVVPAKVTSSTEVPCCAPAAPMPPCSSKVDEAPLPPTPEKCYRQCRRCRRCCEQRVQPIKFIANEFLRKPIYGVQKAAVDAEARRLCCMECRLKRQAQCLSGEAARLTEKAKKTAAHNPLARLILLEEERAYAAKANRHAVRCAKLECERASYCKRRAELEAKHAELFPTNE